MRPQRKPFVVEIKKSRRPRSKSSPAQAGREAPSARKGIEASVGLTLQREDRG
ncbi:hypothetical protein BJ928_104526 [Rhizobium sp. WW_1]|jgi:hypothetical protein|nr:hypothetical protein BJ928_104526 [Rhizobium sp. WW_1]